MTSSGHVPEPTPARAGTPVLLGVASWLGLAALTLAGQAYSFVWVTLLALVGAAWFGCRAAIRDIAERGESEVDEYELVQRHRARGWGYLVALGVLLVLSLLFSVAVPLAERGGGHLLHQAPHLVLVGFLLAAATPSFLLAWESRRRHDLDG